jgi:hypothetical protein
MPPLTSVGKTGAVIGENGLFIVLIAMLGDKIPPEYLVYIHTGVLVLKAYYLHWQNPPDRVRRVVETIESVISHKTGDRIMPITTEDRITAAAQRIFDSIATTKKYSREGIQSMLTEEITKPEEQVFSDALAKLSPLEKLVIQSRLAEGDAAEANEQAAAKISTGV